jgi:hypothetical protein
VVYERLTRIIEVLEPAGRPAPGRWSPPSHSGMTLPTEATWNRPGDGARRPFVTFAPYE